MRINLLLKGCGIFCILAVLVSCSSSSSTNVNPYAAVIAEGRAAVSDAITETGATAVSVALVDGDRVVWSEAFGTANKALGKNADRTTLFGICSVSKMLATVSTMILVDQGLVSLDAPVTTYIKNFTMPLDQRYRNITVRMLLNHSSGLPGNDLRGAFTTESFPGYAAQAMNGLTYQRLKHDPGAVSAYNNDGFTMIENLVKAVTGQEYQDFVRHNILTPLGMDSSRYLTAPLQTGTYAASYNGNDLQQLYFLNAYGSGGLFSTPEEMSRLASMFINNGRYGSRRILSEQSVAAMAQDQRQGTFNPVPYESYRFGLGWDTMAQPGLAAVGIAAWQKTGDLNGYYGANITVLPGEKLGVVVLGASNTFSSGQAVKISERILLRALVERGRIPAMPNLLSTDSLPLKAVTAEEKATFAGNYASSYGTFRLNFGSDDSLTVEEYTTAWGPKFSSFKLRSDGWYAADGAPTTGLRLLVEGGRTYFAYRKPDGYGHYYLATLFGQRLDAKPSISAPWQARIDEKWLPVNNDASILILSKSASNFDLSAISGLTGYLRGKNILRDFSAPSVERLDGMFLFMADGIRDFVDVGMETWYGQNWLRAGSYLYRPLSGVSSLTAGVSTVTIDNNGFAEWRVLPTSGSVAISGSGTTHWFLYDAGLKELASGTASGSPSFSGAGSHYLVLFGPAGSAIGLNLATP
jgi:CubicO group peptidase (beta-lactamase class C family)